MCRMSPSRFGSFGGHLIHVVVIRKIRCTNVDREPVWAWCMLCWWRIRSTHKTGDRHRLCDLYTQSKNVETKLYYYHVAFARMHNTHTHTPIHFKTFVHVRRMRHTQNEVPYPLLLPYYILHRSTRQHPTVDATEDILWLLLLLLLPLLLLSPITSLIFQWKEVKRKQFRHTYCQGYTFFTNVLF